MLTFRGYEKFGNILIFGNKKPVIKATDVSTPLRPFLSSSKILSSTQM